MNNNNKIKIELDKDPEFETFCTLTILHGWITLKLKSQYQIHGNLFFINPYELRTSSAYLIPCPFSSYNP